jgi:hypothetical protein
LKRTPGFAIAVTLSLALGVGAVGSLFAIMYGVLLAPLPYGEPERLVSVGLQAPESGEIRQPPALQVTYAGLAQTLDGVGFHRTGSTNVWTEGSNDGARSVIATWVTASMMPLLRVPPLLGRSFTADEELRGGPDAVILSESEWRMRFGAAADVVGKTLMVNSVRRQIIGVMPARFSFPSSETRVWLPAKRAESATVGDFAYSAVARLASGASIEQAHASWSRSCREWRSRSRGWTRGVQQRRGLPMRGRRRSSCRCATRSPAESHAHCGCWPQQRGWYCSLLGRTWPISC